MHELYSEVTQMFRGEFGNLGRQGTFDDVVLGQDYSVLEVPYWSWKIRSNEIRQRLSKYSQDQFRFVWPLLRDCFDTCHALISSRDISITPWYPLLDRFPSFEHCPKRVYMSATVADDSSIVRTFDADVNSVSKPIVPTSLAGVGERMILTPGLMLLGKARPRHRR